MVKRPKRIRRRSISQLVLLSTAFVVMGIGYVVQDRYLASSSSYTRVQVVTEEETVLVSVPSRIIARGERIDQVPMHSVRWPKSRLSSDYLISLANLKERYARVSLPSDLPIPISALASDGPESNVVAEAIPEGMRAITVRVDAESAIEGWAQSGNFVDVILIRAKKDGGLESSLIAENVKILSAGASILSSVSSDNAPKAPTTITLLTSQQDALRIKTAVGLGKLSFALRGVGDELHATTILVDQRDLFSAPPSPIAPLQVIGRAKSMDGRTYVLEKDSSWKKTTDDALFEVAHLPETKRKRTK